MSHAPSLPPLLRGRSLPPDADPLAEAVAAGRAGADPGLLAWAETDVRLAAALLVAPEMPLRDAVGVGFAVALGFADGLGSLAPPETAIQFAWPWELWLNGAACGTLRCAAAARDPVAEPDWLAVAIDVALRPASGHEPGEAPERTTLSEEGCGNIGRIPLIESLSRHTLYWIDRLIDDGFQPLNEAWTAKCPGIGKDVATPSPGRFLRCDRRGGMVLRLADGATRVIPLETMLEALP